MTDMFEIRKRISERSRAAMPAAAREQLEAKEAADSQRAAGLAAVRAEQDAARAPARQDLASARQAARDYVSPAERDAAALREALGVPETHHQRMRRQMLAKARELAVIGRRTDSNGFTRGA